MSMQKNLVTAFTAALLAVLMSACSYLPTTGDVAQQAKDQRTMEEASKQNPLVSTHRGAYFNPTPVDLTTEYPWLKNPVTLNVSSPLHYALDTAFAQAHLTREMVPVNYDTGTPDNVIVNVSYSGDLIGFLDEVKRNTGYTYAIKDGTLTWYKFVTQTFTIMASAGTTSWLVGDTSQATPEGGIGGTQASQSSTAVQTVTNNSIGQDKQYVNNKAADESVYTQISDAIKKSILSPDGTAIPTEALGTITVRDYPANVARAASYIEQINAEMTQQVYVTVTIMEITLSDQYQYGINWNLVRTALGGNGSVLVTQGLGAVSQSTTTPGALLFSVGQNTNDLWAGSSLLLNALRMQGNASVATSPSIMAINGRPSKISITSETGYLAAQTTQLAANVGSSVSIIPGDVIAGFRMYVIPRISGDRVSMVMSTDLSTLLSLQTQTASNSSGSATIQTPNLNARDVYQSAVMRSGDTLVLAGYKQITDAKQRQSFFGLPFLGSEAGDKANTEILITITPIVVNNQ